MKAVNTTYNSTLWPGKGISRDVRLYALHPFTRNSLYNDLLLSSPPVPSLKIHCIPSQANMQAAPSGTISKQTISNI